MGTLKFNISTENVFQNLKYIDNDKIYFKSYKLYKIETNISKIGNISTHFLYVTETSKENDKNKFIQYPQCEIKVIEHNYLQDEYSIFTSTTHSDINDKNVLIKFNINVYKKPHKGWNYRLINLGCINIMNNEQFIIDNGQLTPENEEIIKDES